MIGIKHEDYSKYFFVIFSIFMAVLVFMIIRPFIASLLTSMILSYLFYPIYKWLKRRIKNENISALLTSVIIIIILLIPLFLVVNTITKEAYVGYLTSKQKILAMGDFFKNCDSDVNLACGFISYIGDFLNEPKVIYHLQTTIERVASYIIDSASNLVFSIPKFVLNFFVIIFTMFYLFKDGHVFFNEIKRILPLRDIYKRHLFEKFGKVTFAIIYGYIVVAVIQGIFGAIGFFIFGITSPLIWGIVMTFAALIPFIGTSIVWLPAAAMKLFNGISTGNNKEIVGGVLFIFYGIILISGLDNLIRPKIIGDKAKVHPVFVLVGVLGGIYLIGFIGAIAGPLILALFVTFVRAYERDVFGNRSKKRA